MTNGSLVSVPHEGLHGAISILEQRPELPTNMCKAWAVKDVVPLIAYCMCIAQCAPAQLPGDHWQKQFRKSQRRLCQPSECPRYQHKVPRLPCQPSQR